MPQSELRIGITGYGPLSGAAAGVITLAETTHFNGLMANQPQSIKGIAAVTRICSR